LIYKEIAGWAVRRAFVGAGEEMIFSAESDGPDHTLDRIVVEVDTAIIEETAKG
jgi:hypothetical protein